MKKIFVLLFGFAAFSQAFAAGGVDVCAAKASAASGTAIEAGTGKFVATAFTPKCSANTYVAYEQSATVFAVGAASSKGKSIFSGSTNGGGVSNKGNCAAATCAAGDATGATTAALSAT